MKIQANEQTKDGVWGVMLSGWVGDDDAAKRENVFSQWLTKEEASALGGALVRMTIPLTPAMAVNGVGAIPSGVTLGVFTSTQPQPSGVLASSPPNSDPSEVKP